jgi:hypothetical protein
VAKACPRTETLEATTARLTPTSMAACKTAYVETALLAKTTSSGCRYGAGIAPRCTTASHPCMAPATCPTSVRSTSL